MKMSPAAATYPMARAVVAALALAAGAGIAAGPLRPRPAAAAGVAGSNRTGQSGAANAAIDAIFVPWDRPDSPGCALGVVQDGELTYEKGYGSANLDWHIPIGTDTVFYVGSVSKQFTAAAVALMALNGDISLDDDVRDYFPELPRYERPITVRQLIHHTSGIRDIYTLMALAGIPLENVFSDEQAISLIAAQKATNFPPGDEHLYSNSGYFLLAQLVERVSGKPLREYARERIFEPLGMRDTHFHDRPEHIVDRRAISYQRGDDGSFRVGYLGNFDKVGAGGLYTTVRDLLLWDRNFYTGDVGGQALLDLMHTRGVLTDGRELTYAFGLSVDEYRGLTTVSHSGSMMGFKAAFLQFPEQRFTVLAACNLGDIEPMGLVREVADVYLRERMEGPEQTAPTPDSPGGPAVWAPFSDDEMSAYAGLYYSEELDVAYEIAVESEALWLRLRNTPPRRLRKGEAPGTGIRAGQWRLDFERRDDGSVAGFTVNAGRVTDIRFVKR